MTPTCVAPITIHARLSMTPIVPFSMHETAVYIMPRRLRDPARLRNFTGSRSHSRHLLAPTTKARLWYSTLTHQPMVQPIRCLCSSLAQFPCLFTVRLLLSSRCLASWGLHQNPGTSRIRDLTPSHWTVRVIQQVILCMLRRNTPNITLGEASPEPSEISWLFTDTPCGRESILHFMPRLIHGFAVKMTVQAARAQDMNYIH